MHGLSDIIRMNNRAAERAGAKAPRRVSLYRIMATLPNGRETFVAVVPAVLAYRGHWLAGELIAPNLAEVSAALPYRWHKAWERAGATFWFPRDHTEPLAPALLTLRRKRDNATLATLSAWPYQY